MKRPRPISSSRSQARARLLLRQRGLSLIELMIALTLGLVIIVAVSSIFLSNKQSYGTNQGLSEIQDNSRVAFELLARDIRQAGLTGCGNFGRVANVLKNGPNNGGTAWWANFNNAIRGYDAGAADPAVGTGGGTAQRVAGTSSLALLGASDPGRSVQSNLHNAAPPSISVQEASSGFEAGDVVVVCDPDHAALVQLNASTTTYQATGTNPGNCTTDLSFPTACTSVINNYQYKANAQIAKLLAVDWYVGNNPQGGRSLYRMAVLNSGGTPTPTAQEMVRNVTDMQISFHRAGGAGFLNAAGVGAAADWLTVDALQIALTFESTDTTAGTDAQALTRQLSSTVTLRNRV